MPSKDGVRQSPPGPPVSDPNGLAYSMGVQPASGCSILRHWFHRCRDRCSGVQLGIHVFQVFVNWLWIGLHWVSLGFHAVSFGVHVDFLLFHVVSCCFSVFHCA